MVTEGGNAVRSRVDERIVFLAVVDLGGCKDLELVVQIGFAPVRA